MSTAVIKQIVRNPSVIKMVVRDNERGPKGEQGDDGVAATVAAGSAYSLPAGSAPTVQNSGTSSAAVFDFGIPKGDKGDDGDAATIEIGSVDTLSAGSYATVKNVGTENKAVFNFGIPQGVKGDTGARGATGETGATGNGIASVTKTSTSGLVDTYTIKYTDGSTATFNITNGADGADGADGAIHYTAGPGINITADNEIQATGAAVATWGGIQGDIEDQEDLVEALSEITGNIPTKTSDLTNDSNFVSDASYIHTDNNYTATDKNKLDGIAAGAEANVQSNWNETDTTADAYIQNKPTLATVATSGSYNDLSNKPALATVATSGSYNDLSNTPTLATVATSGSYSDLSDTPTIPTVNDATLTIQSNGSTVATFTANSSTATTANITSPVITTTTTDPGEGVALAENHFIAVYSES